jgi:hypothetical protein
VPAYGPPPHCNSRGLTSIGQYLVTQMMNKGMIIDPDHMSVAARNSTLDMIEARRYGGVVSSHSWSTPDAYKRILKLGGVVTPIAEGSEEMVKEWKTFKAERNPAYYYGIGWGADFNGFHKLGGPRADNGKDPVTYPFKSFDGRVTFARQRTGTRVFDINEMGVAHYGLYPDWIEDLRHIAGDQIVKDLAQGSEAYLEMWERAVGVAPRYRCKSRRLHFSRAGLGPVAFGISAEDELRSAGQPVARVGRTFTYCVRGGGSVRVTFDRRGMSRRITYRVGRRVRTRSASR